MPVIVERAGSHPEEARAASGVATEPSSKIAASGGKTAPQPFHILPGTSGIATVLDIGLINNMPDAALESTERQFIELLDAAARNIVVRLRLFCLPEVPRSEAGQQYLRTCYSDIVELWSNGLDGLIVTGTEPRAPSLKEEPYWGALTRVADWADANAVSAVWSCLAAHAAVLHMDGIGRHALADKRFGVFDCAAISEHPSLAGVKSPLRIVHSRWNELHEDELAACDYVVLTRSAEAGADMFRPMSLRYSRSKARSS
jgi:homoserine O-succinyltransferase